MARLAILSADSTEAANVIEGDPADFPDAIDVTGTGVSKGWQYDSATGAWSPPPQPEPEPTPVRYRELTKVQFLDHLQTAGGVSDADLVASRNDSNLGAFWLKFELAQSIARDDTKTGAGLDALVSLGYLTSDGKQAVIDQWPQQ